MKRQQERRRHARVRFSWPFFFGYEESGQMFRGQTIDVSRTGISFLIENQHCPPVGHSVLTRFSYPQNSRNLFEMNSYFYWASVVRSEEIGYNKRRVGMELHRYLDIDPSGEPALYGIPALASA